MADKKRIHTGEQNPFFGKHHSDEFKKKQSERRKGKQISPETQFKKGHPPWIKGKHHTEEAKLKLSQAHKGKGLGRKHTEEAKRKISEAKKGHNFREGTITSESTKQKIAASLRGRKRPRMNAKRKEKGFVLITNKNPYDEPIEYHHPNPELPYVVPCPKRIHQMFNGMEKTHFQNVNAMLGINIPNPTKKKNGGK